MLGDRRATALKPRSQSSLQKARLHQRGVSGAALSAANDVTNEMSSVIDALSSDTLGTATAATTADGSGGATTPTPTASVLPTTASTPTDTQVIASSSSAAAAASQSQAASQSLASVVTLSNASNASQGALLSANISQSVAPVASTSVVAATVNTTTSVTAAAAVVPVAVQTAGGFVTSSSGSSRAPSSSRITSVLITSTATINGHLTTFQTLVPTALSPFSTDPDPPMSHRAVAGTIVGTLLATAILSVIGFLFWRRMSMQKRERAQQKQMSSRWGKKETSARRVLDDEVEDDVHTNYGPGSIGEGNGGGTLSVDAVMTEDSHRTGATGVVRARTIEQPYEYGMVGSGWAKRTMSTYSSTSFYGSQEEPVPPLPFDASNNTANYSYIAPPHSATSFVEKDPSALRALRAKKTGSGSGSIFREDFGDAEKASVVSGEAGDSRSSILFSQTGEGRGVPRPMPSLGGGDHSASFSHEFSTTTSPLMGSRKGLSSTIAQPWSNERDRFSTVSSSTGLLAGAASFVGVAESREEVGEMQERQWRQRRRPTSSASESSGSSEPYGGIAAEQTRRSIASSHQYPPDTVLTSSPTSPERPLTTSPRAQQRSLYSVTTTTPPLRPSSPLNPFSPQQTIRSRSKNPRRRSSSGSGSFLPSPLIAGSPASLPSPAPPPPGAAPSLGPMASSAAKVDEQFNIHANRYKPRGSRDRPSSGDSTQSRRRDSYILPDLPLKGDGSLRDEDSPPGAHSRTRRGSSNSLVSYLSAEEFED
ncbi:hypothetical protein FRB97_000206 [Tulasnella sp. 331]|nr:hypothetical protein FRB97_000206 [Tulasnella sp. 331]